MGQALLRLAAEHPETLQIVAADRPCAGAARGRRRAVLRASELPGAPVFDVAIDFSLPEGFDPMLALCVERGAAGVGHHRHLQHAAPGAGGRGGEDPAGLGVELQPGRGGTGRAGGARAQALAGWDCDIVESHHTQKKDAPSGTALTLGAAAQARREPHYASLCAGIVGEHLVQFTGLGERIELVHRATNRDIFARRRLFAARQLQAGPGSYRVRTCWTGRVTVGRWPMPGWVRSRRARPALPAAPHTPPD
jgi:4-hydroxy-tetrahydrodipicolinate reductase